MDNVRVKRASSSRFRTASNTSPVSEGAALQADRIDGGLDVGQPLAVSVAHRATSSRSTQRTSGLRSAADTRSTRALGDERRASGDGEASALWQADEQPGG